MKKSATCLLKETTRNDPRGHRPVPGRDRSRCCLEEFFRGVLRDIRRGYAIDSRMDIFPDTYQLLGLKLDSPRILAQSAVATRLAMQLIDTSPSQIKMFLCWVLNNQNGSSRGNLPVQQTRSRTGMRLRRHNVDIPVSRFQSDSRTRIKLRRS